MRNLLNIIPFLGFLLLHSGLMAQYRDTSLFTVYSQPFFYNVMQGGDGRVFAGTSEGIYELDGGSISRVDSRIGYIRAADQGLPVIDSNGLRYHNQKTFLHLLPFPDQTRDEYHAGGQDFFYITDGGRLYIYKINPYQISYKQHSVRAISPNFTGTYSGIYFRGNKQARPFPTFCDGHIREINGKAFICYNSLLILDIPKSDSPDWDLRVPPPGFDFDGVNDVMYSDRYQQYIVASKRSLGAINKELTRGSPLFNRRREIDEIALIGEIRNLIFFASGNELFEIHPLSLASSRKAILPGQIMDGELTQLNYYLLTADGLYVVHADGTSEKLTDLMKAHTLLRINDAEYVVATDVGLYLYNTVGRKTATLIRGVEFNRHGLFLQDKKLYAGSINGLYTMDVDRLKELINENEMKSGAGSGDIGMRLFIAFLLFMIIMFALLYIRAQKKLKMFPGVDQPEPTSPLGRADIESFINENLSQASLKSISEHFDTNVASIYTLLAPEKPGAFINRLRMQKVQQLRQERKTAREIAEQTGFSESYVRRIWNQGL